jgi:hypothetical protein
VQLIVAFFEFEGTALGAEPKIALLVFGNGSHALTGGCWVGCGLPPAIGNDNGAVIGACPNALLAIFEEAENGRRFFLGGWMEDGCESSVSAHKSTDVGSNDELIVGGCEQRSDVVDLDVDNARYAFVFFDQ